MGVYTPRLPWDPVVDLLLSVATENACLDSLTRVVFELYHRPHTGAGGICRQMDPLKACGEIVTG